MPGSTIDDARAAGERTRSRRADAYDARSLLWAVTKLDRVASCGRWSVVSDGSVAVRVQTDAAGNRSAGFAGYASCGSVWACPVCARKIAGERQREVDSAVEAWRALGGAVAMGSLTVSHRIGNSLLSVWAAITTGWASITSGRGWIKNKASFGVEGWLRVVEVTHGANGWHVHIHTLFFLHHELSVGELNAFSGVLYARWGQGIGKHGFTASADRGVDLRAVRDAAECRSMGDYFNKAVYELADGQRHGQAVSLEVTRADLKRGRNGSRTPFQLLAAALCDGDADALGAWGEYERGSKGKRQIAWSQGFRKFLGLLEERTDEAIAADVVGTADDDVVILPRETVDLIRYSAWRVLDAAEVSPEELKMYLQGNGFEYWEPV